MINLSTLRSAVAEHAAIRRRLRLQPVGGPGDKVFPQPIPEIRAMPEHVTFSKNVASPGMTLGPFYSTASKAR